MHDRLGMKRRSIMNENATSPRFIALIPAYKPMEALPEFVRTLTENGLTVVVVNDGSGEAFSSVFEKCVPHADVCHHAENAGKGAAIKTGLTFIAETYGENTVIVTVDADGQHTVKDALAVCADAETNPHTLVIGSRKFTGKVPLRSRFGNSVTRFVFRITSGVKLYDTQTGLRAFTGDLIPALLAIKGTRYEYEMNMLLEFARQKIRIMEHDIETIYENDNSSSHFKPVRDSIRIYAQILKFYAQILIFSLSSLLSFVVDYIMFALIFFLSSHLVLSNVAARVISATVNFTLNRKFVFKSRAGLAASAIKYILLAAFILVGNTLCLYLLVDLLNLNQMLAKIITECVFFVLSWLIQKVFVFKEKKG